MSEGGKRKALQNEKIWVLSLGVKYMCVHIPVKATRHSQSDVATTMQK